MNRLLLILMLSCVTSAIGQDSKRYIARQGQISFFSYTSVENIEATNNQVLSIIDPSNKEIAISMLMRAFIFKKSLMQEHFNESYVESDIYPKATFEGKIGDLDLSSTVTQTKMVKGILTIHGVSREATVKTNINFENGTYILTGDFTIAISDYEIKVPPILVPNISKTIDINFRFVYQPYEK